MNEKGLAWDDSGVIGITFRQIPSGSNPNVICWDSILKRGENVGSFFDPPNILCEAQGGRRRHRNHLNLELSLCFMQSPCNPLSFEAYLFAPLGIPLIGDSRSVVE